MSTCDDAVRTFVADEQDRQAVTAAVEQLRLMAVPDATNLPQGRAIEKGVVLSAAVVVMPGGKIEHLDPTQIQNDNDNWLVTSPQYVLVKQADHDYLINTHEPLGSGAAGKVYKACILPHGNEQAALNPPIVVKAASLGEEAVLKQEVQFVTKDVVPHGKKDEKILRVGNHSIAIFNYIPGKKLVKEIGPEGITVEHELLNLDFADRCQLAIDLCAKIYEMHKDGFCHLDLNWDNVLVEIDASGQYKDCHIFDHGQSQYVSEEPLVAPVGKLFWNSKEANLRFGYGMYLHPLLPRSEIDIVPLGVMCNIVFAAKTGMNPNDYNPFKGKQEAIQGKSFNKQKVDAVVGVPFVIHNAFIDPAHWTLNIATADRLNELIHVFLECMVSDFSDERPTAVEAKGFFEAIKKLNLLNNSEADAQAEGQLLSLCENLAFKNKETNDVPPLLKAPFSLNDNWYAGRRIDLRLRMLSCPSYLMCRDIVFCQKEIEDLIPFFKEENILYGEGCLQTLMALLKNDSIEKQTKIHCVRAVVQIMLLDRKKRQLEQAFASFFLNVPEAFKTIDSWDKVDQGELDKIDEVVWREQLKDKSIAEIMGMDDETVPRIVKKRIVLQEKRSFKYRKKELEATRETILSEISGNEKIKETNQRYSLFQFNDEDGNSSALYSSGDEADSEGELLNDRKGLSLDPALENTKKYNSEGLDNTHETDEKKCDAAIMNYDLCLSAYKSLLESVLAEGQEAEGELTGEILTLKEPNPAEDPVFTSGTDFLNAAQNARGKSNYADLTTVLNYNSSQLLDCMRSISSRLSEEHRREHKEKSSKIKLDRKSPTSEDNKAALTRLEGRGETQVVSKALFALGAIFGVTMLVTAGIALVGLLAVTCPPAVLALPVVGPMIVSAASTPILAIAAPAIMAAGAAISFGFRAIINSNSRQEKLVRSVKTAAQNVDNKKKEFGIKNSCRYGLFSPPAIPSAGHDNGEDFGKSHRCEK